MGVFVLWSKPNNFPTPEHLRCIFIDLSLSIFHEVWTCWAQVSIRKYLTCWLLYIMFSSSFHEGEKLRWRGFFFKEKYKLKCIYGIILILASQKKGELKSNSMSEILCEIGRVSGTSPTSKTACRTPGVRDTWITTTTWHLEFPEGSSWRIVHKGWSTWHLWECLLGL